MSDQHTADSASIDVAYVAHLARLYLTDEEREQFQRQLDDIVQYVRQLQELDVEGIEPTAHAIPVENEMRDDEVAPSLEREQALANAPEHHAGHFVVPKIIE